MKKLHFDDFDDDLDDYIRDEKKSPLEDLYGNDTEFYHITEDELSKILNSNLDEDKQIDVEDPELKTKREVRQSIESLFKELSKSNINLDNIDIIVRKDGDKYIAKIDNKRDLKLREIFKEEL